MRTRLLIPVLFVLSGLRLGAAEAPSHDRFRVAVYIPVFTVERMKDPVYLQQTWDELSGQVL